MTLRHGSLFSGIGGIDLGLQWAGIETVWQVERDPFCRRVLEKHWPRVRRFSDVRECGKHNLATVDIISGGFPCQDISVAGKRRGLNGRRSRLFWQMARIIRELRPRWVLIENVSRLLRTHGDGVLAEMEGAGYECWPFVLGAKEIGATHQRSRAWILCRRIDAGGDGQADEGMGVAGPAFSENATRALAAAIEEWNRRRDELVSGNGRAGRDAYAGIVRASHGIPYWLDRLRAVGNAVVPQIPMLFGCFIASAGVPRGHLCPNGKTASEINPSRPGTPGR